MLSVHDHAFAPAKLSPQLASLDIVTAFDREFKRKSQKFVRLTAGNEQGTHDHLDMKFRVVLRQGRQKRG